MIVLGSMLLTLSYPGYMFPGMMKASKDVENNHLMQGMADRTHA